MDDTPENEEEITLPETHEEFIKRKIEAKQYRKDNNLPPLDDKADLLRRLDEL